ncbi:hypothetical protein SAMN04488558_1152 [Ignavigranum ruoffiae]|uniref:Uncharacterized protein n=1 Tax=Ignavigranum ruoffiae TaxID=89093 RepID=A0A1H9GK90_9LACT|nr:hypothetical protein SAMN04488558_1152 [Ignavigranum ruoffiae]
MIEKILVNFINIGLLTTLNKTSCQGLMYLPRRYKY